MAIYHPADIAKLLKVKEATVRKYSLLLEDVGYSFKRNRSGQRWYSDRDVVALQKLVALKGNGDMKLEDAAKAVLQWSKSDTESGAITATHHDTESDSNATTRDSTTDIEVFGQMLKEQEQRYMAALSEMQRQQQERDKLLLETISELRQQVDQQKQLPGQSPDAPKVNGSELQSQQPKKGIWARLFKN